MEQIRTVLLAVAAVFMLYVIVRMRGTKVRSTPGQDDLRGRRVRVSTMQQRKGFTVRTQDGKEHTYRSLDEMPYELRSKVEAAGAAARGSYGENMRLLR